MHNFQSSVSIVQLNFCEKKVKPLAVCMQHMDKQYSNFYAKKLSCQSTPRDNVFGVHGLLEYKVRSMLKVIFEHQPFGYYIKQR